MTNFKSEVIINGVSNLVESEKTESAFWKEVALLMYNQDYPVPATIQVISEDGKKAEVQISKLEKYTSKEDKISIDLVDDELFLPESHYEERMLRRIDSEKDIRSRYDMRPNNMGPITINIGAISGQIGRKGVDRLEDGVVHKPFRSQLYWLRYYEKLSSGYKDYTESLKADEDESKIAKFFAKPSEAEMVEDSIQELYKMLTGAAKSNLLESGIALDFYSDEAPYTRRQVTSARKLYLKMCAVEFASEMNELLDGTINYDLLGKESLLVKDGNLYIGDVEIETGTLYVEEVLHYQAPRVILQVRAGNSGKKKLFVYNVIDDKFFAVDESLFDEILDVKKYENVLIARLKNVEQTILKESDVEAAELDPDDLKLAVQTEDGYSFKVDTEKFVLFKDGFFVEAATFVLSEKSEIKEVKNNFLFIQEVNKEMISIDAPDGFIDVTVDGPSLVREVIISFEKILLEDGTEEIVDVHWNGTTTSIPDGEVVESIRVTNDGNYSLLIETNEGFIYSNNYRSSRHAKGSVAKSVIADYPYFVSLEPGTHRNVFTLANEKYEVVKLEVVKTNDRGFTTNVIE